MKPLEINQMIVVTDGRSNVGGNPVTAAKEASDKGIIVNVIGIREGKQNDEYIDEVREIAKAGKGLWEDAVVRELGQTMLGLTRKTINKTVQTMVDNKLKEIIGGSLGDIPPEKRNKVVNFMDDLSDEATIRCCILMDCSGSMNNKINTAKQSVMELMNSLQGRTGKFKIAIIAFPGEKGQSTQLISPFTDNINEVKRWVSELRVRGTTPTAAAINRGISLFGDNEEIEEIISNSEPLFKNSLA